MASQGFNVARVFVDSGGWTRFDGVNGNGSAPLSRAYVRNLALYLQLAANHKVYVMVTLYGLPLNSYFLGKTCAVCPNSTGDNRQFLDPSHVAAKAEYAQLLVAMLRDMVGLDMMTVLFAISIENEAAFFVDQHPFSQHSGVVTTADGQTYNMADPRQREAAADGNAVNWADTIAVAIKSVVPSCMVTVGMFTFHAVGKPKGPNGLMYPATGMDVRYPLRPTALANRSRHLDFLDVHIYPVGLSTWTLAADLASDEWGSLPAASTVLMGEFGGFRQDFPTVADVATYMPKLQAESCSRGFAGWLYWSWDTWEQLRLHYMTEGAGSIAAALAPASRPDPCQVSAAHLSE